MTDGSPLARYLVPLRRWWQVIIGVLAVGLLLTWLTLPEPAEPVTSGDVADPDTTFRATHLLIRNQNSPEPINFDLVQLLARQGDLTSRVLERMDDQVSTGDVDDVNLQTDAELGTIAITTEQPTPDLAASLATTYAEELQTIIDGRASESLRRSAEVVSERLPVLAVEIEILEEEMAPLPEDSLDRRLLEAEMALLIDQFAASQAEARSLAARISELEPQFETLQEPAPVPADSVDAGLLGLPTSPPLRFLVLGMLALGAGLCLAFVIDYLDTRVRTREDAEQALGLPVVAELPPRSRRERSDKPVPVVSEPSGITAEAFRALRLSVLLAPAWRLAGVTPTSNGSVGSVAAVDRQHAPRVLLVTSPLTGDGKTMTVANLAASFAESGQRVLVVDADFRRPTLGELLGVGPGRGLRDIDDPRQGDLRGLIVPTAVGGVSMIRSGEVGIAPAWFLDNASILSARVRAFADAVIFDTGPIMLTNEAAALIPSVDATLLVVRAGKLTRVRARATMEQLTRLGATMAGAVMVGTQGARRYGYYTATAASTRTEKKAPLPWLLP